VTDASPEPRLTADSIGTLQAFAQSVTHMAPAFSIAFGLTATIGFAGAAAPLSMALGVAGALLVAHCVIQLIRHIPSAGYYMSYLGQAFSKEFGFLGAWLVLGAEVIIPAVIYVVLAPTLNSILSQYLHFTLPGGVCILALAVVVHGLSYAGLHVSQRASVLFSALEMLIFSALALTLIFHSGHHNSLAHLGPHAPGVQHGWSGIFKGMIFAILALLGFETAAPLAEETRNPRRSLRLAIFGATISVGVIYVVAAYAGVTDWGVNNLGTYATNSDPWHHLAVSVWSGGWVLVFIAIINSVVGNALAGQTGGSRFVFAMSRARVLPHALTRLHPKFGSPIYALAAMSAINVTLALVASGVWGGSDAFDVLGTIATLNFMVLYILACLAVPVFYRRRHPEEFKIISHLVLPLAGAILFVFPIYYSVVPLPAAPVKYAPFVALGWLVIGAIVLLVLRQRRPQALVDASTINFVDTEVEATHPVTAVAVA